MPTQKPKPPDNADDPAQSRRFIDMAKEVGADESPKAMERVFKKVIQQSPETDSRPKRQKT